MTIYIALLRGINVGGKNIMKMAELKNTLEAMGLSRVQTYIQSGNVLFESSVEEEPLRRQMEEQIQGTFSLAVPVILRKADDLRRIADNCPFSEEEVSQAEAAGEGESLYVSLMLEEPPQENMELLSAYRNESEDYRIVGKEVFLLFCNSIRNSKLASNLHKLGGSSTIRNWKTINKLLALAKAMEN